MIQKKTIETTDLNSSNAGILVTARCYAERGYATVSRLSVCDVAV